MFSIYPAYNLHRKLSELASVPEQVVRAQPDKLEADEGQVQK